MAKNESSPGKTRVSLDLSEPFNRRLSDLERLTHAESKAHVIRQALQLYDYVARKTLQGYTFMAVDKEGIQQQVLLLPYLTELEEPVKHEEPALV